MANLGKIKKNGIASLIKNDICKCRTEDAEHPERVDKNKVTVFYRKNGDGELIYGKVKKWDNYKVVQNAVDVRMRDRLQNCKDVLRRGDIVGAGSLICHVPEDIHPEDEQKFLDGFLQFCIAKFGKENMLMVAEHHHEHRIHSQAYFMPIVKDKTGQEKLCAKEYFTRSLYQTLHDDLNKYMDNYLGYHVSIILDVDNPKKRKNSKSVNTLKIRTLKKEIRQIRKEMKELQKKAQWFSDTLAKLEGRLNKIYEEYPETRRVRGSKRQPTAEDLDKRYHIATHPIQVEQRNSRSMVQGM